MTRCRSSGPAADRARLRARLDDASIGDRRASSPRSPRRRSGLDADAYPGGARSVDRPTRPTDDSTEPLTAREIQVLELLAEGLPNKAIAGRLGISDQTVKFHVAAISGKLGAANRTDAVRRAVRRGLIAL